MRRRAGGRRYWAAARRSWGRWAPRTASLRTEKAGAEVLPDFLTHRAEAVADVAGGGDWRALRRFHQEPEDQIEDDADAGWREREDHEDDADQQDVDAEVG